MLNAKEKSNHRVLEKQLVTGKAGLSSVNEMVKLRLEKLGGLDA